MRREVFAALLFLLLCMPGAPAQTERPPVQVSFYRLRLEYSTTSDWSTLEIRNPASVLSIRRVAVDGTPTNVETAINRLALNQPLSASKAGQRVGVTVDLAVAPEALQQPLAFLLQTMAAAGRATRYYPLLADTPTPKIWAATVQPGYDDRLIPGRRGLFQDRQNGSVYRSTFEAALASDPDWIFITTWNEWWEHTYIEPSELCGDQYLKLTREFADRWKSP
jgi:hypothetical protein